MDSQAVQMVIMKVPVPTVAQVRMIELPEAISGIEVSPTGVNDNASGSTKSVLDNLEVVFIE
jgi:hypothetical protein